MMISGVYSIVSDGSSVCLLSMMSLVHKTKELEGNIAG